MKPLIFFPVLALISVCAVAQKTSMENEAVIRTLRAASNDAIAKQNVDAIAANWLPDFVQVRGNGTYLTGKDTIISIWKKSFKDNPNVSYVRNPEEITISNTDSMAWETGKWIGINSYSKGGKYSAMWRKRKGMWKLQAELFVALE